MKFVVYSKDNCSYCLRAKALLQAKGYEFEEIKLGKDIIREEFIAMYPHQRTLPLVLCDDKRVGGYTELVGFLAEI